MFPPHDRGRSQWDVRLRDAEQLLDILAISTQLDTERLDKVRWMLEEIGPLIGPRVDLHIILVDDLDREPFPRVVERVTYGATFARIEPREDAEIQRLLDCCGPVAELTIPAVLKRLHAPTTYIYSYDTDPNWFANVFKPQLLEPNGWIDCMTCYWAASPKRMILLNAFLPRGELPFGPGHEQLLSLATRAIAPVMDSGLIVEPLGLHRGEEKIVQTLHGISRELHPLLLSLLQGQSPDQIARAAGTLRDEVEIASKKIYDYAGVTDQAHLMAQFVDQRVLDWLDSQDRDENEPPGAMRNTPRW